MGKSAFLDMIQCIVDGDLAGLRNKLSSQPNLATLANPKGATRQESTDYFYPQIRHYLYEGDTALHMAAAAFSYAMVDLLAVFGASPHAKNRRGAEPLHYAADSNQPGSREQGDVIRYLVSIGADPMAVDNSGVAPLHRAVRTRSVYAVRALLDAGASPFQQNGSGSTPLHLAVQNTGRPGSGSDHAREQQAAIIELLIERGASPADPDRKGKLVHQAAKSEWIRELLMRPGKWQK
jgi:ankyrin repeat protein